MECPDGILQDLLDIIDEVGLKNLAPFKELPLEQQYHLSYNGSNVFSLVINTKCGGFGLSDDALKRYKMASGIQSHKNINDDDIPRDDNELCISCNWTW